MELVLFPCHSSSLIHGTVIDFGTFLDFAGTVHCHCIHGLKKLMTKYGTVRKDCLGSL